MIISALAYSDNFEIVPWELTLKVKVSTLAH